MARVLFVCLGNICRSPMAHATLRAKAEILGRDIEVDGAGTGAWHIGNPPDPRAQDMLLANGIDGSDLRARQVTTQDFMDFDLILAMDQSNLADLQNLAPKGATAKLALFLDYAKTGPERDVPDPYYHDNFDQVFHMIDHTCDQILASL